MSLRERLQLSPEPVYLMDGSAFIFRSFYAFRNMSRSDGFPTNALYMVARMVLKMLREEKPAYFGFIMDGKGPTFRHALFSDYKANRTATPEPLVQQLAPLRELLGLLGVPVIVSQGCEADDCIASLAARLRPERPVVIVGADKDLKQCLAANVVLWDPASKDEKITTLQSFQEETGMQPDSWPDYQALVGDSSDNIPGVAKIGPKTALGLIQEFQNLENLFDRLPAVSPKIRPKLEGQRETALLCRELTRLQQNACPGTTAQELSIQPVAMEPVLAFMAEYELRALSREVESMARAGFLIKTPVAATAVEAKSPTRAPERKSPAGAAGAGSAGDARAKPVAGGLLAGVQSGPQPVTPVASASGDGQSAASARISGEQGSLFAAAPVPATQDFAEVEDAQALDFDGAEFVALLALAKHENASSAENSPLLLAFGESEVLFTGEDKALAERLLALTEGGLTLVATDVKALCAARPQFRAIAPGRWFDISLAAYLLNPEDRGYGFDQVAGRWADVSGSRHAPLAGQTAMSSAHPGLLALDVAASLAGQMAGASLTDIYTGMELPLVPVLVNMEERGIGVDKQAFADFLTEVQSDLDRLTEEIHGMAGRVFNIRSAQQLSDVLFTVLDLPRAGKTRGGAASTSVEALEKLAGKHPVIESILEYRKLEKLRSTYLEPLPRLADVAGRIHTTFNQTATATGRLSSSNPNLQNIPVRGALGHRMRACFVAAKDKVIVSADYSQVELRVLAHLSGDPTLLEAFRNNEDIHSRTAGLLFDVPTAEVTPEQRRNAKTINFGLVYGMGAQKLAQELRISVKEAKAFIERYFERLKKLKEFYDAIEEDARRDGYVATMSGRRRLTPDISSQNNQLKSQARRQAINTRIQGSAADIIKLAMLAVENDPELKALGASLLLQIHDELLLEVPSDNAEKAGKRLAELMSSVRPGGVELSVPLLVDWGKGDSWAKAH